MTPLRDTKKRNYLGQCGNAIVEFAVLTPFLIFAVLAVVEMGRYAYFGIVVTNAARAGASYGARLLETANDKTGMETAATNDGTNALGTITFPVPPSSSCKCYSGTAFTGTCTGNIQNQCASGKVVYYVTVQVRGTANSIFQSPIVPKSMVINRTVTMRVQNTGG